MQIVLPSYSINTKDNERILYQSMKQRDKRSDLPSPYLHQFVHFESIEYKISGKFWCKIYNQFCSLAIFTIQIANLKLLYQTQVPRQCADFIWYKVVLSEDPIHARLHLLLPLLLSATSCENHEKFTVSCSVPNQLQPRFQSISTCSNNTAQVVSHGEYVTNPKDCPYFVHRVMSPGYRNLG